MEKLYDRIDWHNNTTPAINETNLNKMSKALNDLDDRVILIAGDILVTVPELQEMLEDCTELEQRLEAMTENPPYIGGNGHWYIWDTDTGAYVDSGIDASITVEIADITMLEPNATPYVTNTGTDTDPIFHLFIPRGQPGKGISSIAKTGTSGYVDTYTITYTDGTTTTYTVTNGRNTDQVSTIPTASASLVGTIYQYIGASTSSFTHGFYYECQNVNGSYQWVNIPVGNDPVEVSNSDPYIYRQGNGYLADMEIVGASVAWNQLVPNSGSGLSVTIPSGRKYIMKKNGTYTVGQSDGTALTGLTGGTDNVHDLSPMLGSTVADAIYAMEQATAGAGVAFFRKYFPKDYYAYDAGSIQSVCVGSRKVVTGNLLDESTLAVRDINSNNRVTYEPFKIFAGTYTISKQSGNSTLYVKDYSTMNNITTMSGLSATFTVNEDTTIYITSGVSSLSNYTNVNVMLEKSASATNYKPYSPLIYLFDSTKQLRGMFSLVGGELKANGDVRRGDKIQRNWLEPVDLGTLTWDYNDNNKWFRSPDIANSVKLVANNAIAKIVSTVGVSRSRDYLASNLSEDKCVAINQAGSLFVRNLAYTDAATFKTAMSGIYLTSERATPTTESAQPYQNPQRAYIDGTEEFTDGLTRDVMIPVGNNSVYQQDKVLPSIEDYVDAVAEQKSDISAIGTNEDKATASQAYTVGQHFYKDGKFCTVIANIASGGTFTLNTNYVEGTIAQAIEALQSASARIDIDPSAATIAAYPVGTMYLVTQ